MLDSRSYSETDATQVPGPAQDSTEGGEAVDPASTSTTSDCDWNAVSLSALQIFLINRMKVDRPILK